MQQPSPSSTPSAAPKTRPINASSSSIDPKSFGFEEARHLLWRAGFGGTVQQVNTLANWGLEKSVSYLVDYEKNDLNWSPRDPGFSADIIRPPGAEERREAEAARRLPNGVEKETALAAIRVRRQNAEMEDRKQMRQVQQWWLERMIETPRPLEEKLVLLWHGHFATSYRTVEDSWHMFMQNEMFRKHAAGNFGDMLYGIIRDPAMIAYLNNNESRKNRPNENLARELMELFSLGVGNYTEQDIKEGAKALTGFTFRDDSFVFDKNNHDGGRKSILGRSGQMDGDDFVKAILEKRECARFVATKLYRHFVHDFPTGRKRFDDAASRYIDDLARTLAQSRYELKPVLKKLFMSQHFYDASVRGEQIKSPTQLTVGAVRSLNTPVRDMSRVADAMSRMGQDLFYPPSVKGWDGGRTWINTATMFVRQNLLVFLLSGKRPEGRDPLADQEPFNADAFLSQVRDAYPSASMENPSRLVDAALMFMIGRTDPAGRDALEEYVLANRSKPVNQTVTRLLMLISAMPEYQLC